MRHKLDSDIDNLDILIEVIMKKSPEERLAIFQKIARRLLKTHSTLEVVQVALGVDSLQEVLKKLFQADSMLDVALKIFQVDTPEEVALQFIHSEEQIERLIELMHERDQKKKKQAEGQESTEKVAANTE